MPENIIYIAIILGLLLVIGVLLAINLRKAKLQPSYNAPKTYNYGFLGKALAMVGLGLLVGIAYIGTTTINQSNSNLNNQTLASSIKADIDIIKTDEFYSVYLNIWNTEVLKNLKVEFEVIDIFGNRKFDTLVKNSDEIISVNVNLNPKPTLVKVRIYEDNNLVKEIEKGF